MRSGVAQKQDLMHWTRYTFIWLALVTVIIVILLWLLEFPRSRSICEYKKYSTSFMRLWSLWQDMYLHFQCRILKNVSYRKNCRSFSSAFFGNNWMVLTNAICLCAENELPCYKPKQTEVCLVHNTFPLFIFKWLKYHTLVFFRQREKCLGQDQNLDILAYCVNDISTELPER